jgi:hypothetical protein
MWDSYKCVYSICVEEIFAAIHMLWCVCVCVFKVIKSAEVLNKLQFGHSHTLRLLNGTSQEWKLGDNFRHAEHIVIMRCSG